jgi:SH3-like domain-containing protein
MQKWLIFLFTMILWTNPAVAMPNSETGLPLPRFVSIKTDEANLRKGPGTRYPIHWVYRREGLPLEVINEFGNWRQVRDHDHVTGWMHHSMLSGYRHAMILAEAQILRRDPSEESPGLLKVMPNVIAELIECGVSWCKLQVEGRKGWLQKSHLWGVYPQEFIE